MFSVQGVRVVLDAQRGWCCTCTTYAESRQCPHVEQAQTFRKMRGAQREEDTIELQVNAAQLQELWRAAYPENTDIPPTEAVPAPELLRRHARWTTFAAAAAMSAISSGITYLATTRALASRAAEPPRLSESLAASPAPQVEPARELPVTFVNPFDAAEVFEFPPATSEAEARDAVAELLLQRARDRQTEAEMRLRSRQSADGKKPDHTLSLADSG